MRNSSSYKWILVRLLTFAMLLVPFAPSSIALDDDTEKELINQAEDLFDEGLYIEAFPLFSQLLSLYPDNINYNYKFSVCMLFADEEKSKAIKYLEKVTANKEANKEAFFYLGYAYHLNYQFNKAITAYNTFKSNESKKIVEQYPVDRKIEMCENGLTLMRTKSKLGVISKTEIKETEYFRTYDMDLLSGRVFVKPNDFKTSNDIDKDEESLVYLGKNAKMLFYSSYGKVGENRDLYMVLKKKDGAWGEPQRLPDYINSEYDENFPIMQPNRNILYFSSKGHNSMGGYDIFKAKYDSSSNRWSKPVNVDFPINSADDDILYLPTKDERTAYFSSKRSSIQGKISVYKIMLKEPPGRFTSSGEPEIATAEPLAIEDILATAQLDVNAKEKDFAEAPVRSTAPTTSNTAPSESIQAETFTDLTNDQLVDVGFEYAENIKKDQLKLQKEADLSFETAREKKQQSTAKATEARDIRSKLDNVSDPAQKNLAILKAQNLEDESKTLNEEAELAFEFAKDLTSEADTRKQQSEKAFTTAEQIKTAMANNQKDESISLLINQKVLAQSIENNPSGVAEKSKEKETQAKEKETQATEAKEKIQFMASEITEIEEDIKTLLDQAERTKDPVIKEEILSQAQELEAEKLDTETELASTKTQAKTLNREADVLRKEADLLADVSNDILASSGSSGTSSSSTTASTSPNPASETPSSTEPKSSDPGTEIVASNTEPGTEEPGVEAEPLVSVTTNPTIEENGTADTNPATEPGNETENESPATAGTSVEPRSESDPANTTESGSTTTASTTGEPGSENDAGNETESGSTAVASSTVVPGSESAPSTEPSPEESFDITPESLGAAMTEETVIEEMMAIESLEEDAKKYEKEAVAIREKAEKADPAFRENALKEADKHELAAAEKRTEAAVGKSLINTYSFTTNVAQYNDLENNSRYLTPQDKEEVRARQEEATSQFETAQAIRKEAKKIKDPIEKARNLKKAEQLEVTAIATQDQVNNSLTYKENKGAIAEKSKTVGTMESEDVVEISKYYEESDNLYMQAKGLRENAENITDLDEKKEAFRKADALERQALEKQQTALHLHELYKYEDVLFEAVKTARTMSSTEKEDLDNLQTQYITLAEETKTIRTNAETLDDPEEVAKELKKANEVETQALNTQRNALHIYFESDEELTQLIGEDPSTEPATEPATASDITRYESATYEPASSSTGSTGTTESSGTTGSNEASEPLVSVTPTTNTGTTGSTPSNTTTANRTGSSSSAPTPSAVIIPDSDPRSANELISDSETNRTEAKNLYESIENIDDPEEMMAALDEAEQLEKMANAEMARAKKLDPENEAIKIEAATATGQPNGYSNPSSSGTTAGTSTGSSAGYQEEPKYVGDVPIEEASPEDIIAMIMNGEEGFASTERTAPSSSTNTGEEEFSINDNGESEIEYVDNSGNETDSGYETGSNNESGNESFDDTPTPTNTDAGNDPASSTGSTFSPNTAEAVTALSVDEPLVEDIFAVEEMISYTPSNPIPVNPIIPSGLLFKVQIGAFRNPIPQNLFKGINPIMGEKTAMGFIRYSAGLFRRISTANEAKGVIRGLGYKDAFVVAFYNGVRVSIADARRMLEDGTVPQPISSGSSSTASTAGTSPSSSGSSYSSGSSSTAVPGTTDIATIEELFYTVQVGVYSKPSDVGAKFNLNDLYTVKTSNGYIRYNEGRFASAGEASNRKESVVAKGISDAFVTAYYNGKRISLTQARTMPAASIPEAAPVESPAVGTDDTSIPEETITPEETSTPEETPAPEETFEPAEEAPPISMDNDDMLESGDESNFSVEMPAGDVVYMVKIGEFGKDVPVDEATSFIEIKDLGIEVHNIGERAIYTVGEFIRYEEAEVLRLEVEIRGIEDANIVVEYEDDIISVEEYLRKTLK